MIYSYIRVSTQDQAESENGFNAQRDAIGAVDREFEEIVSGAASLDKRPVLMDLISIINKGDIVKVHKRDRIGRDPIAVAMIEAAIKRKGALLEIASGEASATSDNPADILMARMIDAFAEYERLVIKSRTKSALKAKKERAELTGNAPIGFKRDDDDHKQLAIDNTEQQIIEIVHELRRRGESLQQICYSLEIQGFINKRGRTGKWHKQTISNILNYRYSVAQKKLINPMRLAA